MTQRFSDIPSTGRKTRGRLGIAAGICVLAFALSACGYTPGQRAVSGGAIGAGAGAAIGAATGGSAATGALIGGAAGALGGAVTAPR